ncbi:MAG TPA: zinc metalloprotease HtpX [Phycisphaerae bacterium]|nr:zinc metalloprotease HtpX [Phycisphaerae bacterium]
MTVFVNGLKTAMLLGLLMGLCLAVGYGFGGEQGLIIGLVCGGGMSLGGYFLSDKIALASVGARPVTREEAPELYEMTETLAKRAGLPMPRLYFSPEQAPNAFATGRNPKHAVVCVTAGLMQMMSGRELEGVIGHELSHVKHRDILISTIAAIMAGAIAMLAHWMMWFGGGRRSRDSGPLDMVAMLLMILLAPLAAGLIQMAISRSREYAADASGAYLAGGPEGLIAALKKLEVGNKQIPMNVPPAEGHMFIMKPLTRQEIGEGVAGMFRTHPPTEKRIAKLLEQMGKANPYA